MIIVGVDIGGTHITSALVDLATGTILEESYFRSHVNTQGDAEEIVDEWARVIGYTLSFQECPIAAIGIAMPGPFDYKNGICLVKEQGKFLSLYKLNIGEMLASRLNISPSQIKWMNDASCFLQGEMLGPLEEKYSRVLGFTLGTGLGACFYNHGNIEDADMWQLPFRESIAEDYTSTRWFTQRYQSLTGGDIANVQELLSKPQVSSVFHEFALNLAQVVLLGILKYNPELIILGGNIAQAHSMFLHSFSVQLHKRGHFIPVSIAQRGESAALVGAAGIWKHSIQRLVK